MRSRISLPRSMRRRGLLLLLFLVILAGAFFAASQIWQRQRPVTIAVIPRTCGTWLWEALHTGTARTARQYGYSLYWNAPMREDDVQGQIDVLTHALDEKMQGIILAPVESLPLLTPVRDAVESRHASMVIVGTDLAIPPGKHLSYVLNDEAVAGRLVARRLGMKLHGRGHVAILGINHQLAGNAVRDRSFEETLSREFPQIEICFRSLALPNLSQEQQVAEKMLAADAKIDAIVALSEASMRGAYYALIEYKRIGGTTLIGFDQNFVAPMRTGEIDSVVMQNTFAMGCEAMRLLHAQLLGLSHEPVVTVEPILVTRENIDSPEVRATLDLSWFQ